MTELETKERRAEDTDQKPRSRIFFGTFAEPGRRHLLDLNAFAQTPEQGLINAEDVIIRYYDDEGRIVATDEVAETRGLYSLRDDLESRCLVMIDAPFAQSVPSIYGYMLGSDNDGGVFYPVNAAIGYPEISVWLNRGIIPIGPSQKGWHREVFIANVSRWAPLKVRVRFHSGSKIVTARISLDPKTHLFLPVDESAKTKGLGGPVDWISVVSNNKPMVYVIAKSETRGDFGFIEHLVPTLRRNLILTPAKRPNLPPETDDLMAQTVCWCLGVTVEDVTRGDIYPHSGDYCTACRDDLKFLRRAVQDNMVTALNESTLSGTLDKMQSETIRGSGQ